MVEMRGREVRKELVVDEAQLLGHHRGHLGPIRDGGKEWVKRVGFEEVGPDGEGGWSPIPFGE